MDSKQIWYGYYLRLDIVCQFLSSQSETAFQRPKVHELFITWIVARFLQFQKKSEHVIGFPSFEGRDGLTLHNLLAENMVLDNENFDTVITDARNLSAEKPKPPIKLQVKRYTKAQDANTDDFFRYMCRKVRRYGKAPEISVVFHILQNMRLDFPRFAELLTGQDFEVGSIIVFSGTPLRQKCFLFEVHPKYTGQLWSPAVENE